MEFSLRHIFFSKFHIVAQIVKAELVICPVGDITVISGFSLFIAHIVLDCPYGKPEELINRPHPVAVTPGQIVVDRNHMHAAAGKAVQISRKRSHQGLSFAVGHLGNHTVMQSYPADKLDIIMAKANSAPGRFAHHGKGLG